MTRYISPEQAAKLAKCGRSSIMRALSSGVLPAIRDNRNRWKITPEDVEKWSKNRPDTDRTVTKNDVVSDQSQTGHIQMIAQLGAENVQLHERLGEMREERDKWRAQAEALAIRPVEPAQTPTKTGIWGRIFGKG